MGGEWECFFQPILVPGSGRGSLNGTPAVLKTIGEFRDSTRMKIVMNRLSLARAFNCDLILEGAEHSTAEIAAGLGIPLGQQFFFG